jgi:predicted AlkP superfamily pyrophosphatase or phosphodiesterase
VFTRKIPPVARSIFLLALGMCSPGVMRAEGPPRVILITIDGLAGYYLSDSNAPLPTLRRMAAEGAVAEGLRVSNPSTTWPNHTSLVTGVHPDQHAVLFNGLLIRGDPGRPVSIEAGHDKSEFVATPTIYDHLHAAGLRTAAINWPCTRGAMSLDDNLPDTPNGIEFTTPRLRAELVRAGILSSSRETVLSRNGLSPDQVWTAAALHVLRTRPPSLLLLHLLETDVVQHRNGPSSPKAYEALAQADARVAEVLGALGPYPQTTVLVASDHGFARPFHLINPNVILRQAGLTRPGPRRRAQSVSEGGTAFVYLTNPATRAEDRARVIALLRGIEGVADILEPAQFAALHLPSPAVNSQAGDLLLVARPGYAFSDEGWEDEPLTPIPIPLGSHGYLASTREMQGVLIAWGRGIKPGAKLGLVNNVDVAPTIAALLGQEFPTSQGRVLRELLTAPKRQ